MAGSLRQGRFWRVATQLVLACTTWALWAWLAVHWIVARDLRPLTPRCREALRQSPMTWLGHWCDEQPLCVGEHPRHWYQGRLGLSPWRPVVWDPMVYGGYLVTPWWEARGRLATVWLAASDSWSAYKLGLLITLLALPLLWWLAGWWFGRSFAAAWLSMVTCGGMFWLRPGAIWLAQGELDLLAASGLVPVALAGWCAWQSAAGLTVAVTATVALGLLLWVYPLAGTCLLVLGVFWYLRIGAKQSAGWHLATLILSLPAVLLQWPTWRAMLATWWLLDWHLPSQFDIWSKLVRGWSEAVSLALCMLAAAFSCWYFAENRSAGRTWMITMFALAAAGFCPGLPLPEAWQPARLAWLVLPVWLIPLSTALVAWRIYRPGTSTRPTDGSSATLADQVNGSLSGQVELPSSVGQRSQSAGAFVVMLLALAALVGLHLTLTGEPLSRNQSSGFIETLTEQEAADPPPESVSKPSALPTLLAWLNEHTTLQARIAVEEDAHFWVWSPLLIASSGRQFVNGLAREVPLAQHELRWDCLANAGRIGETFLSAHTVARPASGHDQKPASAPLGRPIGLAASALRTTDAESRLAGRRLQDWSLADLTAELDRWNVGWLLVRQSSTAEFLKRLPGMQVVAQDAKTGWHLLARPFPGYFERGQGKLLRAQPGQLTLAELHPEGGACVLRCAYVPGLITSLDRCRPAPAPTNGTAWPQLQLFLVGPQARLTIRFEESAKFLQK